MNVGSLFSGIGGLDHGLHNAGHRHVFFCEADPYRRDVLGARWPGVPVYDDVRAVGEPARGAAADGGGAPVDLRGWEAGTGLLCGGFPCQDLSVAGRRAGLAGVRSGLFHEFARIIDAVRPRWVLVENVPGLLSSNGGRDFGVVLGTLADLGYGVGWRVLDSRFFGVPQRRRRVYIVGALIDDDPRAAAERASEVLAVGSRCQRHPATSGEAREDVAVASLSGLGSGGPDDNDAQAGRVIAATLKANRGRGGSAVDLDQVVAAPLTKGSATGEGVNAPGRRQEDDVNIVAFHALQDPISDSHVAPAWGKGNKNGSASIGVSDATGVRRLTPTECERLQGLPDGWTQLGSTPDSRRYSALGDAVTATVGEWIGRRLA